MTGWIAGCAVAAVIGVTAGCATKPDSGALPVVAIAEPSARPCGTVLRVREAERWVVLECSLPPPPDSVVVLARDGTPTARVRTTLHRRGPHVVAEIIEGRPKAGDMIEGLSERTEERP